MWSVAPAALVLAICVVVPSLIGRRDDAVLLANPRPPVPEHGRILTVQHNETTMAKVAAVESLPASSFASSFDMYYEARTEGCDQEKTFVMVGGTNGASWQYHDLVGHFHDQGYCTLNFDHRSHGRSEVTEFPRISRVYPRPDLTPYHPMHTLTPRVTILPRCRHTGRCRRADGRTPRRGRGGNHPPRLQGQAGEPARLVIGRRSFIVSCHRAPRARAVRHGHGHDFVLRRHAQRRLLRHGLRFCKVGFLSWRHAATARHGAPGICCENCFQYATKRRHDGIFSFDAAELYDENAVDVGTVEEGAL